MTTRRPSRRPAMPFARRGVMLAAPTLLLAGCGMLPGLPGEPQDEETDDGAAAGDASYETAAADSAVVELAAVEVDDTAAAEQLMTPLDGGQTLLHPLAQVTVTASALLDSLEASAYTALTGEEAPQADEGTELASVVLPGEGRQFLLASWESTDPEWSFVDRVLSTALEIMVGGVRTLSLGPARPEDAERAGTVLAIVDKDPEPAAATLRAETEDGAQEISLVDGSITETLAPALYERELAVEVTDAGSFETMVKGETTALDMSVRGTFEEAFLTPFVEEAVPLGGRLGWAEEDELHLVAPWRGTWTSPRTSRTSPRWCSPSPTAPRCSLSRTAGRSSTTSTADSPRRSRSRPRRPARRSPSPPPRYGRVLDKNFEQVEDPVSATLTFS